MFVFFQGVFILKSLFSIRVKKTVLESLSIITSDNIPILAISTELFSDTSLVIQIFDITVYLQ